MQVKKTSWAGFVWSKLKLGFEFVDPNIILTNLELNWEIDGVTLFTAKNKNVSSAKSFGFESKFSFRSLMHKRSNGGPGLDP